MPYQIWPAVVMPSARLAVVSCRVSCRAGHSMPQPPKRTGRTTERAHAYLHFRNLTVRSN